MSPMKDLHTTPLYVWIERAHTNEKIIIIIKKTESCFKFVNLFRIKQWNECDFGWFFMLLWMPVCALLFHPLERQLNTYTQTKKEKQNGLQRQENNRKKATEAAAMAAVKKPFDQDRLTEKPKKKKPQQRSLQSINFYYFQFDFCCSPPFGLKRISESQSTPTKRRRRRKKHTNLWN